MRTEQLHSLRTATRKERALEKVNKWNFGEMFLAYISWAEGSSELTEVLRSYIEHVVCIDACVFPPTFNGLLDFSVLPLDLVYRFVLLLPLVFLSVLDLCLLPLLAPLFRLVGVLCGSREEGFSSRWSKRINAKIYSRQGYAEHSIRFDFSTPPLN